MENKTWQFAKSLFASTLLWSGSAAAVDGVIEINQAKAVAGGVNGSLVADPAGFPVVITQPGSYRLTGNLTVPNSNTTAIQVGASAVDIDLNGFAILGPNTCSGTPTTCTANGTGVGVLAPNPAHVDTRVHDGTVKGMGSAGVAIQGWGHVSRVNAQENGGTGIAGRDHSIVSSNRLILNGGTGIFTATRSSVQDNRVGSNGGHGIQVQDLSTVGGNTISGNGAAGSCGIEASGGFGLGASASQNTVFDNPAFCGAGTCCSLSGFPRLLDCNMIQEPNGALQRCCPDPVTGAELCF